MDQSPTNTTVTVKYFVGGGIESNVKKGDIKQITSIEYDNDTASFSEAEQRLYSTVVNSVNVKTKFHR